MHFRAALAAAAAVLDAIASGVCPRYVDGPLLLPDNVMVRGAGMERTAIYFAFREASNTPPTMIGPVKGTKAGDTMYPRVRFGVEDLALCVVRRVSCKI